LLKWPRSANACRSESAVTVCVRESVFVCMLQGHYANALSSESV